MTPYLKSSGPVPGELAVYLDPRLEKLDQSLAEMRGLIEATLPSQRAQPESQSVIRCEEMAKTGMPR